MNRFYEAELDFYVCAGDAYNHERASLYMTQKTFEDLKEKIKNSDGGIHYDKNGFPMYKTHPIIIDNTFNAYRVIKIPTTQETLYYSWWR